jgi:hypothetical protein
VAPVELAEGQFIAVRSRAAEHCIGLQPPDSRTRSRRSARYRYDSWFQTLPAD